MSRESTLAQGRTLAEAGMLDTCTITEDTASVTDQDTGVQTITTETIYSGPCRVQQRVPGGARPADVGEAFQLMLRLEVQVPMSATGFKPGQKVTIDSSVNDADLTGRVLRIRELAHKTEATARRLGVEEVT